MRWLVLQGPPKKLSRNSHTFFRRGKYDFERATDLLLIERLFNPDNEELFNRDFVHATRGNFEPWPLTSSCINTSTGALSIGLIHLLKLKSPIQRAPPPATEYPDPATTQWCMIQKGDFYLALCMSGPMPHADAALNRSSQVHLFLLEDSSNHDDHKTCLILLLEKVDEVYRLLSRKECSAIIIACEGPMVSANEGRWSQEAWNSSIPDAAAIASWSLWTLLKSTIVMFFDYLVVNSRYHRHDEVLRRLFPGPRLFSAETSIAINRREIVPLFRGWMAEDPQEGSIFFRERYPSLLAKHFSHIRPTVEENRIQFVFNKDQWESSVFGENTYEFPGAIWADRERPRGYLPTAETLSDGSILVTDDLDSLLENMSSHPMVEHLRMLDDWGELAWADDGSIIVRDPVWQDKMRYKNPWIQDNIELLELDGSVWNVTIV